MTVNAYVGDGEDKYHCDDDILEAAPENPVRFLSRPEWVWTAMVDGIEDADRLEAYRQAEKRHINRSGDATRVHKYLDKRERELAGDVTPEPETPAAAIADGGTVADTPETTESETEDTPDAEPDDVHPTARWLDAGEVLRVDRDSSEEYIFAATPAADSPYLLRAFDDRGDERTEEPVGLTNSEIKSRLDFSTELLEHVDVDVRPPAGAATLGGGDR